LSLEYDYNSKEEARRTFDTHQKTYLPALVALLSFSGLTQLVFLAFGRVVDTIFLLPVFRPVGRKTGNEE
jgi:hypothetical protein